MTPKVVFRQPKGHLPSSQRYSSMAPKVIFCQHKGLLLWVQRPYSVDTKGVLQGSKGLLLWAQRSSSMGPKVNCNPCDFFLWGYLKERAYHPIPTNLATLKRKIMTEFKRIPEVMVIKSILDMKRRGGLIVELEGGQFEGRSI